MYKSVQWSLGFPEQETLASYPVIDWLKRIRWKPRSQKSPTDRKSHMGTQYAIMYNLPSVDDNSPARRIRTPPKIKPSFRSRFVWLLQVQPVGDAPSGCTKNSPKMFSSSCLLFFIISTNTFFLFFHLNWSGEKHQKKLMLFLVH